MKKTNENKNTNTNRTNSMIDLKVVELPDGKQTTATTDQIAFVKHSDKFNCYRFCFLNKPEKEALDGLHTFAKSYTKGEDNLFVPDLDICWWSPKSNRTYYTDDVLTRKLNEAHFVVVSEDCFVSLVNERIAEARDKDAKAWEAFILSRNKENPEAVTMAYNEAEKAEEEANNEVAKLQKQLDEAKAKAKAKAEAKAKEAIKTEAPKTEAPKTEAPKAIKPMPEAPKNNNDEALKAMIKGLVWEVLQGMAEAPKTEAKSKAKSKAKAN